MKQPPKYQIHLKSQNGPIHVLLVNKDAAADSPVVTPVPPPINDINANDSQALREGEEAMDVGEKETNDLNGKGVAVKTEVLDSSRGIILSKLNACSVLINIARCPVKTKREQCRSGLKIVTDTGANVPNVS